MSHPYDPFDDEDTQEIPVVDDVDHHAATRQRTSDGTPSEYTLLPSDAFAPKHSARSKRFAAVAAAAVVTAGAVGVGLFALLSGDDDAPSPSAAAPASASVSGSASAFDPADPRCPSTTDGAKTTGRDAGSQNSGSDVIKAFNYAYYVDRNANAVSRFVLPASLNVVIPSIANLQKAIDGLPQGTTHCLTMTDLGSGLYRVDLAQIGPGPDGDRITFHQMIQTTNENGRWLIVSNTAID